MAKTGLMRANQKVSPIAWPAERLSFITGTCCHLGVNASPRAYFVSVP